MVSVKFLKPCPPYNAGEVAGFNDDHANRFIELGSAELVVKESPKVEAKTEPSAPKTKAPAKE